MRLSDIEYLYVDKQSPYYGAAADLRYKVFFEPSNVPISAVYDEIEDISYHLVAISQEQVVGYIRLTIENGIGRISQFVVDETVRGSIIGKKLIDLAVSKAKEEKAEKLWGEIRLHVEKAAKIYGFTVCEEIIYSKKTGIPHKRIEMNI